MAQAHGGTVEVTSTVKRGSTFSLHLPPWNAHPPPAARS